jgi:hypothetical protein
MMLEDIRQQNFKIMHSEKGRAADIASEPKIPEDKSPTATIPSIEA